MTPHDGTGRSIGDGARGARGLHVCVIDHTPDHAALVSRALRGIDVALEVIAFAEGGAALEALTARTVAPDLILLDLDLPGGSSWEVLAMLAADVRLRTIPVVILSATDRGADLVRAYERGASGHVTAAMLEPDLQTTVAHTRLYWQAMTGARPGAGIHPPA